MRAGLESEYELVANLMYSATQSRVAQIASTVRPGDIGHPGLRHIYDSIINLVTAGETVSPNVIAEHLKEKGVFDEIGGYGFLSEVDDAYVPGGDLSGYHLRNIRKAARHREFEDAVARASVSLQSGEDPEEIHEILHDALQELGPISGEVRVTDDMGAIVSTMDERLRVGISSGIEWPWGVLTTTTGRLMKGEMVVVTGFSGMGKSTFTRALAVGMAFQGVPVVYFGLEEMGETILGLMSCSVGGASYTRYGQGFPLTEDEVKAIKKGRQKILDTDCLLINQEKNWTPTNLLAKIRHYVRQNRCFLVIIDHAHLINYPDRDYNRQVAKFAERLHALAQEEGIVVVVNYQPRKPGEGGDIWRPVSPDEIRWASEIWNIAEKFYSPFRPWVEISPITGATVKDAGGYPKIVKPYSKNSKLAQDHFFIQPGKARIGGTDGKPIVLKFDSLTGRIYE